MPPTLPIHQVIQLVVNGAASAPPAIVNAAEPIVALTS
jgi:hypothetical protein